MSSMKNEVPHIWGETEEGYQARVLAHLRNRSAPTPEVREPAEQDYEQAYAAVEQAGLGLQFRSCSCGQQPCAMLTPLAKAIANARVITSPRSDAEVAHRAAEKITESFLGECPDNVLCDQWNITARHVASIIEQEIRG